MIRAFTESIVEEVAVARLRSLGWLVGGSTDIAPGKLRPERADRASRKFPRSTGVGVLT